MNMITALVASERLAAVSEAVGARGVGAMVATPAQVHGRPGRRLQLRGGRSVEIAAQMTRIEMVVDTSDTDAVEALIRVAAGDSRPEIWVGEVTARATGAPASRAKAASTS